MNKYKVTWKEIVSYEEIIEAESENQAIVNSGAEGTVVYDSIEEGSLKVEMIQD